MVLLDLSKVFKSFNKKISLNKKKGNEIRWKMQLLIISYLAEGNSLLTSVVGINQNVKIILVRCVITVLNYTV